jgi:hypothetical protein
VFPKSFGGKNVTVMVVDEELHARVHADEMTMRHYEDLVVCRDITR